MCGSRSLRFSPVSRSISVKYRSGSFRATCLPFPAPRPDNRSKSPVRPRSWPESPHYTARHVSGGEQTTAENAGTDTSGWGYSLANLRELLFGCLDAIEAKSVLEVGAYKGELTSELLAWAAGRRAASSASTQSRPTSCWSWAEQRPELELVLETSHDALAEIELPDAIVIDGDHNYYTLSEELRIIGSALRGRRCR